ncbi:uncharacterized protein PHACADRAFT_33875, partial [Phanerochaete carnosa HHB-10118-sp]
YSHHVEGIQDTESLHARNKRKLDAIDALPAVAPSPPRHERLWFDDGNVVILINEFLFKIHSSVLELHSAIVIHLSRQQYEAVSSFLELLPDFIFLHTTDREFDFAELLLILYGLDRLFIDRRICISFANPRPIALLSLKYNVPGIPEEVSARLRAVFPANLDYPLTWVDISSYLRAFYGNPVQCSEADCIAVVDPSGRLNLQYVWVTTAYHCCRLDPALPFDGAQCGGERVQLTPDELRLCAIAIKQLCEASTRVMWLIAMCMLTRCHFRGASPARP